MSTLTASQILSTVYSLLNTSALKAAINGGLYYEGLRPKDSNKEDILLIYTTGLGDQIQEGTITINVFVPDIESYPAGSKWPNLSRINTLSAIAQTWVESLKPLNIPYQFFLRRTISHSKAEGVDQHFIHIRLGYKLYNR